MVSCFKSRGLENSNAVTVPPATSPYTRTLHTDGQPSSRNPNLVDADQAGCAYINPSLPTAQLIALSLSPSTHNHPSAHLHLHFSYTNQLNSTKKPNTLTQLRKCLQKLLRRSPPLPERRRLERPPRRRFVLIPSLNLYGL